ncbi:unnamed protein product [Oncorhynchus mykiss]|uniref:Uncharacterized protein n=1 Tax=Oncorhynchus mykiss TaxID=8022 RepID=A0A060YM60_ONCMY|nr:unnamed protein product [Oncorhynchus mykiss]
MGYVAVFHGLFCCLSPPHISSQVSMLAVDDMHQNLPPTEKDKFWVERYFSVPYSTGTETLRPTFMGSTYDISFESGQAVSMPFVYKDECGDVDRKMKDVSLVRDRQLKVSHLQTERGEGQFKVAVELIQANDNEQSSC